MATKINISIPQPCHENWHEMTVADEGRFCNACQKKVFDFTYATDKEIINAFDQNQNLCGRFLDSQLNRDLVQPKEKGSIWLAAATALVSFIGLGTHEVTAQEPVKTEQTDKSSFKTPMIPKEIQVNGEIRGEDNNLLSNVRIIIKGRLTKIYSDENGEFSIKINSGDTLIFSTLDYYEVESEFYENNLNNIVKLEKEKIIKQHLTVGGAMAIEIAPKHRTFFGRTFHSIGNWFK